jgi:hypothetical protein
VWLSLAGCPGGVDHVFAYYVSKLTPGEVGYEVGWGYPHAYGVYLPGRYLEIVNYGDEPAIVKLKVDVRCDE